MSFFTTYRLLPLATFENIKTIFTLNSSFGMCPTLRQRYPYLTRSGRVAMIASGGQCLKWRMLTSTCVERRKGRRKKVVGQKRCVDAFGAGMREMHVGVGGLVWAACANAGGGSIGECEDVRDGKSEVRVSCDNAIEGQRGNRIDELRARHLSDSADGDPDEAWQLLIGGMVSDYKAQRKACNALKRLSKQETSRLFSLLQRRQDYQCASEDICKLMRFMSIGGLAVDASHWNSLIWLAFRRRKWTFNRVYQICEEMKGRGYGGPNLDTWLIFYDAALGARDVGEMGRVHNKMRKAGVKMDAKSLDRFFQVHMRARDIHGAMMLYNKLPQLKVKPDISIFRTLLTTVSRAPHAGIADNLYKDMITMGITPTIEMINSLLNTYVKTKHSIPPALTQLSLKHGIRYTISTLTILLQQHLDKDTFSDDIFPFITQLLTHPKRSPDHILFSKLIDYLVVHNHLPTALNLFTEMQSRNITPDASIYGSLIRGYIIQNNDSAAEELMKTMLSSGLQPDKYILTKLIDGYLHRQDFSFAIRILRQMMSTLGASKMGQPGTKPDSYIISILLNAFMQISDAEAGLKAFMDLKQCGIRPDVAVYTQLMRLFGGDLRMVEEIWREMISSGVRPDMKAFQARLEAVARSSQNGISAENVINEMRSYGLSPDTQMLSSLFTDSTHENERILHQMKQEAVDPSLYTYNRLIRTYAHDGNFALAYQYLEDIDREGLKPNVHTYYALMKGLVRFARWEDCMGVYLRMVGEGVGETKGVRRCLERVREGVGAGCWRKFESDVECFRKKARKKEERKEVILPLADLFAEANGREGDSAEGCVEEVVGLFAKRRRRDSGFGGSGL